ncbi:MAG: hypothetical protein ABL876_02950 [Chitinophagaceae bacterium]
MKSIVSPSHYFSPQTKKAEKKEVPAGSHPQTPYLKAILTGASRLIHSGKVLSMANPDREAAIRYIKESALLRK